jgi:hypothetical protein
MGYFDHGGNGKELAGFVDGVRDSKTSAAC